MAGNNVVTLCGEPLSGLQHVCAFFDSRDEQYEILTPYFKEGLEQGEEVLTIMEDAIQSEHLSRLKSVGVDVDEKLSSGQLKMLSASQTYVQDGVFVAERMFDLLKQCLSDGERGSYSRVRTCGDMEWALLNLPGTEELMEYEARVNVLAQQHDCTLVCAYDVNRFSGRVIAVVLATHSHVLLGNRIHKNPHYTEPVIFLQGLLRRRTVPLARPA